MMKIKMFYFYRQTYLLYYLRKNFFLSLFTTDKVNIFFFLFWVFYYIKFFLTDYKKYLLNYRYFSRIYFNIKTNNLIYFFYSRLKYKESCVKKYNNYIYITFFFSKIFLYHYYINFFFKNFFFLQKNFFSLKNYFFNKISYRYNFFELFWILFEIIPIHWSKQAISSKLTKKKTYSNWFSYLFNVSSNIDTFFNIKKENSFLILAKTIYLKKTYKTFKFFDLKIKRPKRQLMRDFLAAFRQNTVRLLKWKRFGWVYKLRRKRGPDFRTPKRFKTMYIGDYNLFYMQRYRLFSKEFYKIKNKHKIFSLFRMKFAQKHFNLLQRNNHYNLDFNFSLNFNILKKMLVFLSSSTDFQSIIKISTPYSFFSNFRLIYTIFSDTSFIKNILYVSRLQRYYILFNYLKSRFLKKNINKALYSFMFNSNVIYYFFIPKVCRTLLLKVYKKKKLFGFSWIFFMQLNNLFSNLFSSNLFLTLNFAVSEGLSRGYLNQMFSNFLLFNPPKSKYHFLKELCDIYILTGITKDSNLLHCWIIKNLSIIFFRRHWQFLGFLKMTLLYIFNTLQQSFGIKGIFITFRGKIGQVGSVRKKVYFLRQGVHTLSNLSLKCSFNTSVTKTDTGAIGVSVYLFY